LTNTKIACIVYHIVFKTGEGGVMIYSISKYMLFSKHPKKVGSLQVPDSITRDQIVPLLIDGNYLKKKHEKKVIAHQNDTGYHILMNGKLLLIISLAMAIKEDPSKMNN
jgi:hypothetical protein